MNLSRRHFMATAAAASVAPAVVSATHTAQAAAPMTGKPAASFYRFKVGDFEVTTLHDGLIKVANPAAMITNKTPEEINQALDIAMIPRDNLRNPFVPTIVNTGKNLVLIDTGFGDNGPPSVGMMAANLAAAGIDPKNIDTVLITHFHPDHISGLRSKAGDANFPNAEVIVHSVEWKYWNDESELGKVTDPFKPSFAATKRVFAPMAKDVKQAEIGKEVVPGITAIDTKGHSAGHVSYLIASGNGSLLVLGDVTNNPAILRVIRNGGCGPTSSPTSRSHRGGACSTWPRPTKFRSSAITTGSRRSAASRKPPPATSISPPCGRRRSSRDTCAKKSTGGHRAARFLLWLYRALLVTAHRGQPRERPRLRRARPALHLRHKLAALAQCAGTHHVVRFLAGAGRRRIDRRAALRTERLRARIAALRRHLDVNRRLARQHLESAAGDRNIGAERGTRAGLAIGAMTDAGFLRIGLAFESDEPAMTTAVHFHFFSPYSAAASIASMSSSDMPK